MSKEREILGVKITFGLTYKDVLSKVSIFIDARKKGVICTTNPEFIVLSQKDSAFKNVINNSLLSVPDGVGVVLANEYLKRIEKLYGAAYETPKNSLFSISKKIKCLYVGAQLGIDAIRHSEKYLTITGVDFVDAFCKLADAKGYTLFFLGGWPKNFFGKPVKGDINVASLAAKKLKSKYPNLKVVGATSKFSPKLKDDSATIEYIQQCIKDSSLTHIDMLFISYGSPAQEVWLGRNLSKLNVTLAVGVGGSFDYISGYSLRPPKIIRALHLEWLFRLITQPYRLRRIINAIIIFPIKMYQLATHL